MTTNADPQPADGPDPTPAAAPKPAAPPAPKPAEGGGDSEAKRLKSELSGVHEEAGNWKSKFEKNQAELDKINADKLKAAEADATKRGEHETIIETRDKTIAKLESTLADTQREALIANAASKLAAVKSVNARERIAEQWATRTPEERGIDGAFEAFVEAQRKADPDAFEGAPTPVVHDSAGNVQNTGGGSDLLSRLKSDDKAIKKAANDEAFDLRLAGKLDETTAKYLDEKFG